MVSDAVARGLVELLKMEQTSVFRFLADSRPYLDRSAASFHHPLLEMVARSERHVRVLGELVESLGVTPTLSLVVPEDQYLTFLSFQFLLPRLLEEKTRLSRGYESVIEGLVNAPPAILSLLKKHLTEHNADSQSIKLALPAKLAPRRFDRTDGAGAVG